MSSSDDFDSIISNALNRLLGTGSEDNTQKKNCNNPAGGASGKIPPLTPSKTLVIAGLIGNVFTVDSVLVGRDQQVEIILSGTLKQNTQLEKIMDQVGKMSFDDVLKSILGRLI